jgi:hypothetical protein
MPDPLWLNIPDLTDVYGLVVNIENTGPINLGELGSFFYGLNESLRSWSGGYIARSSEMMIYLRDNGFKAFDAGLVLSFDGADRGSWKISARIGGQVATALIANIFSNNIDRVLQGWGADLANYTANPTITHAPLPFERACLIAINAASKLNANSVSCRITGPNGYSANIQMINHNAPHVRQVRPRLRHP